MSQTPQERAAEQRKLVWSGCQSVLGCGGLIALLALAYAAVGLLPRSVGSGPDVIVFINYRVVQNELFFWVLFGSVFFFGALGTTKTTKGMVIVCAIFLAAAAFVAWQLYSRVAALAFQDRAVELRYIWPRPSTRLEPREITSVDYEVGFGWTNDVGLPEYTLHLHTQNRHYEAFSDTDLNAMQQTQQRIKALQER